MATGFICYCIYWLVKFWRFRNKKYSELSLSEKELIFKSMRKESYEKCPEEFLEDLAPRSVAVLCILIFMVATLIGVVAYIALSI